MVNDSESIEAGGDRNVNASPVRILRSEEEISAGTAQGGSSNGMASIANNLDDIICRMCQADLDAVLLDNKPWNLEVLPRRKTKTARRLLPPTPFVIDRASQRIAISC